MHKLNSSCRDAQSPDYESKGWPPADRGILHHKITSLFVLHKLAASPDGCVAIDNYLHATTDYCHHPTVIFVLGALIMVDIYHDQHNQCRQNAVYYPQLTGINFNSQNFCTLYWK